jgi:hypothetical protein
MKKTIQFEKLVEQARMDRGAGVDVVDGVMSRLRVREQEARMYYRPLAVIASFSSAAAACIVGLVLWSAAAGSSGGLADVYQAISWVVQ